MLKVVSPKELMETDEASAPQGKEVVGAALEKQNDKLERRRRLKQKIIALGKMNNMLGNLREHSEVLLQMKQVSLDGRLPRGILMQNRSEIKFD